MFRAFYFEALDLITNCIEDRFSQKDYQIYTQSETLIMAAAKGMPFDQLLNQVVSIFKDDFNLADLSIHLDLSSKIFDLCKEELRKLTLNTYLTIFNIKLVKLVFVMPATNANSERFFRCLQRIKTNLPSTM